MQHEEFTSPVIHSCGIPLRSLIALETREVEDDDYFVFIGNEQRDKARLFLFRVHQMVDKVETQSLLEIKLDGASSNIESLKDGLFSGIIEKSTSPGTLWLNIYKVWLGEQYKNSSDILETKNCIRLDKKMDTSLNYVKLIVDRNTCQIGTVSWDKLLIVQYETESIESFPLSPQDSCYWKPCGDWQPDNSGRLVTIGRGQSVQSWDIRCQDACTDFGVFCSFGQILAVRYFPLRQHFLMGGFSSGKVVVWDTRSPSEPVVSWTAHHHAILDLKSNWSHERLVASCGTDAIVHIWDMEELFSFPKERKYPSCVKCSSLEYHSDTIYALEWGISNEFTIGSVGYDGNFILTTLPSFVREQVFT